MFRHLLLLILFLCFLPASAATFVVGQGSPACTHATLQAAVDAALANGVGFDTSAVTNQASLGPVVVSNQSVWIIGGYDDCSRVTSSEKTLIDGGGLRPLRIVGSIRHLQRNQVILQNLTLSGADSAIAQGGGLSLDGPEIDLAMLDVTIKGNVAQSGGGIHLAGGTDTKVALSNTIITANSAEYGGGITLGGGAQLRLVGQNEVSHNTASGSGGGLYVPSGKVIREGPLMLSHNESAYLGGGAYIAGSSQFMDAPNAAIADNVLRLEANIADYSGGGMWIGDYSWALLSSPQMVSNNALDGGALAVTSNGEISIYGLGQPATCNSNYARGRGSCLWVAHGGFVSMGHTIISQNTSGSLGAAIEVINEGDFDGASLLLEHNDHPFRVGNTEPAWGSTSAKLQYVTVADNSGTTFDVLDKANVSLVSSVIDNPGQLLSALAPGSTFHTDCVVSAEGTGLASIPSNEVASTEFVSRQQHDYRLRVVANSPAIDRCAGPGSPFPDLAGNARGHDLPNISNIYGPYDSGSYEAYDQRIFQDGFDMIVPTLTDQIRGSSKSLACSGDPHQSDTDRTQERSGCSSHNPL